MLHFQGSQKPTLGVEIELQILNSETLDLSPRSEELLVRCQEQGIERVKAEVHQSMIEIDSEISSDVKECQSYLITRIEQAEAVAESMGLQLGVTGTHPFQLWPERLISNFDRYHHLHQKFQWLIRRMNVYGLHVHVGMPSGDMALAVTQSMIRYLPHLLALSANSPFWQGVDTGMQSSRITIIESFPFSGLPQFFSSWKELEHYYDTLHRAGAVRSLKDLYWYIRPNLSFGTVEFRICDGMSSFTDTMAVVAFIHCLTVWTSENLGSSPWTQEDHWIAPENQWIAARDGVNGIITSSNGKKEKISDSIEQLIETIKPIAKRLNCYEEILYLQTMLAKGNGAIRQREVYNETLSLREVVKERLQEFKMSLNNDLALNRA